MKKVAVLNSWGKIRSWGCHMVHHALYQKQNYSYAGIIEALSGAPFDVKFISFDDILKDKDILKDIDVIINVGDGDTAHTGGAVWENAVISAAIREFVYPGRWIYRCRGTGRTPVSGTLSAACRFNWCGKKKPDLP